MPWSPLHHCIRSSPPSYWYVFCWLLETDFSVGLLVAGISTPVDCRYHNTALLDCQTIKGDFHELVPYLKLIGVLGAIAVGVSIIYVFLLRSFTRVMVYIGIVFTILSEIGAAVYFGMHGSFPFIIFPLMRRHDLWCYSIWSHGPTYDRLLSHRSLPHCLRYPSSFGRVRDDLSVSCNPIPRHSFHFCKDWLGLPLVIYTRDGSAFPSYSFVYHDRLSCLFFLLDVRSCQKHCPRECIWH